MAKIKHAGVWTPLITDADYYCDHCGRLVAQCMENARLAREGGFMRACFVGAVGDLLAKRRDGTSASAVYRGADK